MNKFLAILVGLIIFTTSFAIPYAVLGNINVPDAYILPSKMVELSFVNFLISDGTVYGTLGQANPEEAENYEFAAAVSFGLMNRFELGLVLSGMDVYYGNAKVKVLSESEKIPQIAFGVENIGSKVENFEERVSYKYDFTDPRDYIKNSPYFVISKSALLLTGIPQLKNLESTVHFGIGTRRFKGTRDIVKNFSGMFGGIDIKPSRHLSFNVEFDSQNLNLGANIYYQNFTFRGCIYRLEDFFKEKDNAYYGQKFAIGIKYTLDTFSDIKASQKDGYLKSTVPPKERTMTRTLPETPSVDYDSNPLLEELRLIRERRKQAEKELEEIRKLLQE